MLEIESFGWSEIGPGEPPEKGDRPHLCEAPTGRAPTEGWSRQKGTVPFFRSLPGAPCVAEGVKDEDDDFDEDDFDDDFDDDFEGDFEEDEFDLDLDEEEDESPAPAGEESPAEEEEGADGFEEAEELEEEDGFED
jgi:hypothetical protein